MKYKPGKVLFVPLLFSLNITSGEFSSKIYPRTWSSFSAVNSQTLASDFCVGRISPLSVGPGSLKSSLAAFQSWDLFCPWSGRLVSGRPPLPLFCCLCHQNRCSGTLPVSLFILCLHVAPDPALILWAIRNFLQPYRSTFFLTFQSAHFSAPPFFHASSDSFCSVVAFFPLAFLSVIFSLLLQVAFPEPLSVPFACLQVSLTILVPSVIICDSPELFCFILLCWGSATVHPWFSSSGGDYL